MASRWTCECGASNPGKGVECEHCGEVRPGGRRASGIWRQPRSVCSVDGGRLNHDGFCHTAGGYVIDCSCPSVCPECRQRLDWSGFCRSCTPILRRLLGDRYDTHDDLGRPIGDGQHWVRTLTGPRPLCLSAENQAGLARIREILAAAPLLKSPTTKPPGGRQAHPRLPDVSG